MQSQSAAAVNNTQAWNNTYMLYIIIDNRGSTPPVGQTGKSKANHIIYHPSETHQWGLPCALGGPPPGRWLKHKKAKTWEPKKNQQGGSLGNACYILQKRKNAPQQHHNINNITITIITSLGGSTKNKYHHQILPLYAGSSVGRGR